MQVEYIIATIDEKHKQARVSLRAYDVLLELMQDEKNDPEYVYYLLLHHLSLYFNLSHAVYCYL